MKVQRSLKPNLRKLSLSLLALVFAYFHTLLSQGNSPPARVDQSEAQRWRQDVRYMAEEMPRHHKNLFHTMTRAQFEGAIDSLCERIPSLARHQIIVEMARIVAMVGDGHTNIAPTRDPKIGFRTYPLKLYFFKDGLFVRAGTRECVGIVGSRVVRIGKFSVEQAYNAVRTIIGRDNEMGVRFFAPFLLAIPEVLHALGLIDDMENTEITVERHGRLTTVTVKPYGPAEMFAPDTDTSWTRKTGWLDARDSVQSPPLWLRDPRSKFWFVYMTDSPTVYVQFNQVGNKENETVEAFTKRLFAFLEAEPVDRFRFVLDLRLNRGGNGALNRPLLLAIIKSGKVDRRGSLFTIIGRGTWSAAQFLVNDLEKYTNTIFVGEPTGGKVNSYGDSHKIILPNSGITVRVSTLWWQEDERDTRQWTAPQIAADLTFEDYRNNIDPALNAILSYTPAKSLTELLMDAVSGKDPASVGARYDEWKSDPKNEYVDTEPQLNGLGYQLMARKQMDKAIAIFKLHVAAFPQSSNAYDSLGEAYMNAGKRDLAVENYRKALELDPTNANAREIIKRLQTK